MAQTIADHTAAVHTNRSGTQQTVTTKPDLSVNGSTVAAASISHAVLPSLLRMLARHAAQQAWAASATTLSTEH